MSIKLLMVWFWSSSGMRCMLQDISSDSEHSANKLTCERSSSSLSSANPDLNTALHAAHRILRDVVQAQGAAPLDEAAVAAMLERYMLGLACPSKQQQRANHEAVAQTAFLALQRAERVMHEHVS